MWPLDTSHTQLRITDWKWAGAFSLFSMLLNFTVAELTQDLKALGKQKNEPCNSRYIIFLWAGQGWLKVRDKSNTYTQYFKNNNNMMSNPILYACLHEAKPELLRQVEVQ